MIYSGSLLTNSKNNLGEEDSNRALCTVSVVASYAIINMADVTYIKCYDEEVSPQEMYSTYI